MKGKKIRIMTMAVALGILTLGGCGGTEQTGGNGTEDSGQDVLVGDAAGEDAGQMESPAGEAQTEGEQTGTPEEEILPEGYQFLAGDVVLMPDMDIESVLGQLGESKSVYESPSCAGQGISYLYDFGSYEIETYPAVDEVNRIGYIVLKDDMVSTREGIDLSMTREDCIRVYGEADEETENKLTYVLGNTKLKFILDGENIVSIEYASSVIG